MDLRANKVKPVVELLGGEPGKLRAYASSMKRDITPKEEAERLVRLQGEFGYDAFKVRAGAEVGRNQDGGQAELKKLFQLCVNTLVKMPLLPMQTAVIHQIEQLKLAGYLKTTGLSF